MTEHKQFYMQLTMASQVNVKQEWLILQWLQLYNKITPFKINEIVVLCKS